MRACFLALFWLGACSPAGNLGGSYQIEDDAIPAPLTMETADSRRGADLFADRDGAHCILCHQHENISAEFQGNLGPDLSHLSQRLTTAQIRLRIADYDAVKPGTTMPSYFRTKNLYQVDPAFEGQTVLSPLEIEDIIAFLSDDDQIP